MGRRLRRLRRPEGNEDGERDVLEDIEKTISRLVERIDMRRHHAKPWKSYKRARAKASMRRLRARRELMEMRHAA